MTLNEIVASKIKDNRKHVGFTSEAVAEMLGVSKGAYSNLENGKVEITIAKLELLSKIFSRPMDSFLPLGQTVNQVSNGNGSNIGKIEVQNNYPETTISERIKETLIRLEELISQEKDSKLESID